MHNNRTETFMQFTLRENSRRLEAPKLLLAKRSLICLHSVLATELLSIFEPLRQFSRPFERTLRDRPDKLANT